MTKQNILEDVICYWAQKIMRDGNKLKPHLYLWGNCGFTNLLQSEHDYIKKFWWINRKELQGHFALSEQGSFSIIGFKINLNTKTVRESTCNDT